MTMDVTCNIIEDLLPLYADGICSEDAKTIVEHHAAVCSECREKLEAMTSALEKNEKKGKVDNPFKKVKWHYFRLAAVTLLICGLVIAPLTAVFYLKTNEIYDNGYSWASMKMDRQLRKIGKLIKKGEYRKALDEFEPYYIEGDYTDEEISAFKDQYAEILEEYFLNTDDMILKYAPDDGETEQGAISIWDGGNTTVMQFENLPDGRLRFDGFYDTYQQMNGGNYLPYMCIPEKAKIERDFDEITDTESARVPLAYDIITDNYIYSELRNHSEIISNLSRKMRALVKKYGYVGCEGGEVTFYHENLYDTVKLMSTCSAHYSNQTNNYYLQKVRLTMDNGGDKFTADFEIPIKTEYMYPIYTSVRNIVYSDNTPDDFKTMFEDIFVGTEEPKPVLNDGKFYLNGNTESCYYNIENNGIRLVAEKESQLREYFDALVEDDPTFDDRNSFEEWCESTEERWKGSWGYIIHRNFWGSYEVAWNLHYGTDNFLVGYLSARYIDENTIETDGCRFTRVEE